MDVYYKNNIVDYKEYYEQYYSMSRFVGSESEVEMFTFDEPYKNLFDSQILFEREDRKLYNEKCAITFSLFKFDPKEEIEPLRFGKWIHRVSLVSVDVVGEILEKIANKEWLLYTVDKQNYKDKNGENNTVFRPMFFAKDMNDDFCERKEKLLKSYSVSFQN